MSNKIKVEEPNLVAFVQKIEQLINEGYKVSDTNSGVPTTWGPGLYTCEMLGEKVEEKPVEQPTEVVQESEPAVEKTEGKVEETKPKTTRRRKSTK